MVVTFLPYADIKQSVKSLDDQRLGKQRVEAFNIINAIYGPKKGWKRHPATLMWIGYELCLKLYFNECLNEWIARGKKNNMIYYEIELPTVVYPWWWGWEIFHQSHRCALIRKAPWHYEDMFTKEIQTFMMDYGYVWPHKFTDELKTLKFDEELAQKVCEVINPLQLRPMCKTKACKNRAKRHNSDKNDVINKYCGVHYRSVIGVEISESEGEMELESDEEFKAEDKVPKSKNKKEVSEVKSQIIKTKKSPKATAKSSPKTGKNTTKTSISPLKREFRSDTKQSITRSKSKK